MAQLELVSFVLCPYVQRVAIVLAEKGARFTRTDIDLAKKPAWFTAISPTGKVPLLRVNAQHVLFESAAICEYLDETNAPRLLPSDPLERARHRALVEFASGALTDIAGLYAAPDAASYSAKRQVLRARFARMETELDQAGPFFAGAAFGLVDAAFAPFFRYFDVIEPATSESSLDGLPRIAAWRTALAARPSVRGAVVPDFPGRLAAFLRDRPSYLGSLMAAATACAPAARMSA